MSSPLASPKFGGDDYSAARSPVGSRKQSLSRLMDARRIRMRSARSERVPPTTGIETDPTPELGQDRAEISMSLSVRYMQLRDQVIRDRKQLKTLRDEFSKRQESLKTLNEASKEEQINRERLQEMNRAISAIAETIQTHKLDSPTLRMDVIKHELGNISTWNHHVASMLTFIEAQQLPVEKQPVAPIVNSRRSKSPIRHWSP